jgi:hypothetical protein
MREPHPELAVVSVICSTCVRSFQVECAIDRQSSRPGGFYALDCPHCASRLLRHLPGDVVEVRADILGGEPGVN